MKRTTLIFLLVTTLAGAFVACGGDGGDPTTGLACTDGTECADEACLVGFEQLGSDTFDGSFFPGGYCSMSECERDAQCGPEAACVTREGDLPAICLATCSPEVACRDGYECTTRPGTSDQQTYCLAAPTPPACAHNSAWEVAGTCVARFAIADGDAEFQITATSAGLGDGSFLVGPGEVVIQTTNVSGASGDGAAGLLCYELTQNFRNPQGVITSTRGFAVADSGTPVASGNISANVLTWDTCTYSDTYGDSPSSWTQADVATGPGCVNGYQSVGDVNCAAPALVCNIGNLMEGHNVQDGMWDQPFNNFELGTDLATLTMGGLGRPTESLVDDKVEIPNDAPSRTYLGFDATLVDVTCY